jgi:HAD superfamily hydrolase (TIGR01490 family)
MSGDKPQIRAALFDMDRTLVRKETASLYVRYQRDIGQATTWDLLKALYWVGQYTFGILDHDKLADNVLASVRGVSESVFIVQLEDWFTKYVEEHITEKGREAVAKHRARGDVCAIVTGATRYAAGPLAKRLEIEHVVSSELEIDATGQFTGRAVKPLCLGDGKLRRAEALAQKLGFALDEATFYTDSISDLPLLERVAEPIVVNPDPRLTRVAKRRGWPIERW